MVIKIEERKYIKLISANIARVAGFDINYCVLIPDDRSPITYSERKTDIGKAINIFARFPAYVQMIWPRDFDKSGMPFKDFCLNIGPVNKILFVRALEKFIRIYERDDVYYLKDGTLNMYGNNTVIHTCKLSDNYIKLSPTIVTDMNNNVYEGASLFLNKEFINGDVTYSELLAIHDILKDVDMFEYTYLLLQAFKSGSDNLEVHNLAASIRAEQSKDIWENKVKG